MDNFFSGELDKKKFAFPLNTTSKFISACILGIVLFVVAFFVFQVAEAKHFFSLHRELFRVIGFVLITGISFFYILRLTHRHEKDLAQQDYFKKNPSPMWICDFKTRKLLAVNETASDIFGYSRHEFLLMNFNDLAAEDESNHQKDQKPEELCCTTIQRKEGTSVKVALSFFDVYYKKQKATLIISNNIVDPPGQKIFIDHDFVQQINDRIAELILVRRELEVRNREINATNDELINLNNLLEFANKKLTVQSAMAIRQRTEQLKNIIDKVSDSIWSFDLTGKEENYVSHSAASFFGLSKEKIIDCPNFWFEFIHPAEKKLVFEKLKRLETSDETEFSYQLLNPLKEKRVFHQKINIARDQDGKAVRLDCIGRPM